MNWNLLYTLFALICFVLFVFVVWNGMPFVALLNLVALVGLRTYCRRHSKAVEEMEQHYKIFIEGNNQEGIVKIAFKKPMPTKLPVLEQVKWLQTYGYYSECNTRMLIMSGAENVIGKPVSYLITKTVLDEIVLKAFVEKNYKLQNIEKIEVDVKGRVHTHVLNMFGVVFKGKVRKVWLNQRDITAAKSIAKEKELLLEQSKEARRMADIANKEKDRVLANISHELRTPLVSIIGYSEILNKDSSCEEIKSGLEIINRNGRQQLTLIEDLLALSQSNLKGGLQKEDFDLRKTIDASVESMRFKFTGKKLEVKILGEKKFVVNAAPTKITQIFNNLLSNAIKFTDEGVITVTYGRGEENSFFFTVKDTGKGITKSDLLRLFEPYFQSEGQNTTGVGLGLHLVKTFVNSHKGRVEVKSGGGGSEFTVRIPYNGNDLRVLTSALDGLHVLLLEDDKDVGGLVKLFLERSEVQVTWVESAAEAHETLKENKFDLYLSDIAMSGESGIEFLQKLREEGDVTPAVAISAYSEYEKAALEGGFNLFLLKPLSLEKIQEIKLLIA